MGSCYRGNVSDIGNISSNGKGMSLGSCCRGNVDSIGSGNISSNGKGASLGSFYSRSIDDIGSSNIRSCKNGNSGFENTIASLAENENVVEAFSDLQNLANADLSTLSSRELCKLLKFLSCFFCKN